MTSDLGSDVTGTAVNGDADGFVHVEHQCTLNGDVAVLAVLGYWGALPYATRFGVANGQMSLMKR